MRDTVRRALGALDPVDTALRLTLLLFLLRPIGAPGLRATLALLAIAGLVLPCVLRTRTLWLALTVLTGTRVVADWPLADNHSYLLCYWCLAIWLAVGDRDPRAFLAANAGRLIGLVFAFATLWKLVLSPDYLDDTFFRVILIVDPRFETLTHLAGGLPPDLLDASRVVLQQHLDGPIPAALALPTLPPSFERLASFLTVWTVALEGLLALAFLAPARGWLRGARDIGLQLFCLTTFAILSSVVSFGWNLLTMGVAQTEPDRQASRLAYLTLFGALLALRELPWLRTLAGFALPG